jgi:hypothetical protein
VVVVTALAGLAVAAEPAGALGAEQAMSGSSSAKDINKQRNMEGLLVDEANGDTMTSAR